MKQNILFNPIRINSLTIDNRFVMPAMESGMTKDNHFTEQSKYYFLARSQGGFGLIITDYMAIDRYGIGVPDEAGLWDDSFIPGLRDFTDFLHANGKAKIFAQLHHSGAMCVQKTTGVPPKGPSAIAASNYLEKVTAFTNEEVYELIHKYGDAALRAKKAGFDGVEFQACHGYLACQFLSRYFNKRVDEFGGSYTNRFRFVKLAMEDIRSKVGDDFPVIIRLSANEYLDGGNTIDDAVVYARMAEEAGFDAINVSTGTGIGGNIVTPHYFDPGFNLNNTRRIKESVSIPVIAVGRINDPSLAESIVSGGTADMVALGRQSICDPEFPNKVKEGRLQEIFHCTGCMQRCYYSKGCDEDDTGVSCMQNPLSGKENRWHITPAEVKKNICVIGAGPAGLQAGWILAKRGHHVTIYEAKDVAGGNYRLASVPPKKQDSAAVIATYSYLCKKYGAEIHYHTPFTQEMLDENTFDAYIIASGSHPVCPPIPGLKDNSHVVFADQILDGKAIVANQNVLVLGGGLVGCETAEFLHLYGNTVTIVDMVDALAKAQVKRSRKVLLERLQAENVKAVLNTKINQITDDGIIGEQNGNAVTLDGYQTIVMSLGYRNYNPFKTDRDNVYAIGDAVRARDAKYAIYEATKLALTL